jgi:hypothetical protein
MDFMSSGKHTPAVDRLPKPDRSGKPNADQQNDAVHAQLQTIVETCLKDRAHIGPLFNCLSHRLGLVRQEVLSDGAARFEVLPASVASLNSKKNQVFLVNFIIANSDLTLRDLEAAIREDPEALLHVVIFGTGYSPLLKLPEQCIVHDVLTTVMKAGLGNFGLPHRLNGIKTAGFAKDPKAPWKDMIYSVSLDVDGKFVSVTHNPTSEVADVTRYSMDREWTLEGNYGDMVASFTRPPFPALKICTFFDKKNKKGPWSYGTVFYGGQNKDFMKIVEAHHETWSEARKGAAPSAAQQSDVSKALKTIREDKAKESSTKSKDKLAAAHAAKKQRRSIVL